MCEFSTNTHIWRISTSSKLFLRYLDVKYTTNIVLSILKFTTSYFSISIYKMIVHLQQLLDILAKYLITIITFPFSKLTLNDCTSQEYRPIWWSFFRWKPKHKNTLREHGDVSVWFLAEYPTSKSFPFRSTLLCRFWKNTNAIPTLAIHWYLLYEHMMLDTFDTTLYNQKIKIIFFDLMQKTNTYPSSIYKFSIFADFKSTSRIHCKWILFIHISYQHDE